MRDLKHVTSEDGRSIQLSVHEIAETWMRRGFCPECIVRQIIIGASVVVHEVVEDAFSDHVSHHGRHGQH